MLLTKEQVENSPVVTQNASLRLVVKNSIEDAKAYPGLFQELRTGEKGHFSAPSLEKRWETILGQVSKDEKWNPYCQFTLWAQPMLKALFSSGFGQHAIRKLVENSFGRLSTENNKMVEESDQFGQQAIELLHQVNQPKRLSAYGWWLRPTPLGVVVYLEGDITQATLDHYQELAIRSENAFREGTLTFTASI